MESSPPKNLRPYITRVEASNEGRTSTNKRVSEDSLYTTARSDLHQYTARSAHAFLSSSVTERVIGLFLASFLLQLRVAYRMRTHPIKLHNRSLCSHGGPTGRQGILYRDQSKRIPTHLSKDALQRRLTLPCANTWLSWSCD
jgi:hypothetical protein